MSCLRKRRLSCLKGMAWLTFHAYQTDPYGVHTDELFPSCFVMAAVLKKKRQSIKLCMQCFFWSARQFLMIFFVSVGAVGNHPVLLAGY